MSCAATRPELAAYHFGTIGSAERAQVEAHLPGCASCLGEYIALKREIETAPEGPRPSPAARARLRQAMARELAEPAAVRPWIWWERPLAFGFASAAVLVAVMATRTLMAAPGAMPRSLPVPATSVEEGAR
jgi:anti-sigma factor RsiW